MFNISDHAMDDSMSIIIVRCVSTCLDCYRMNSVENDGSLGGSESNRVSASMLSYWNCSGMTLINDI